MNTPAWEEKSGEGDERFARRIALRNAESKLQAGLRAREWVSPDLRLPVLLHSGVEQVLRLTYRCGGSAGLAP